MSSLKELMKTNLVIIDHEEHDDLMSWRKEMRFSFSIPNWFSGMKMRSFMDGDQPSYSRASQIEDNFRELGITNFLSLADYPVDGDTLRYFFTNREDASLALNDVEEWMDDFRQYAAESAEAQELQESHHFWNS